MRSLTRPIIGRTEDGGLILDLRCLTDEAGFLTALTELKGHVLAIAP
jgi:L-seryl-tRNA(Ser) seleniumtransferase